MGSARATAARRTAATLGFTLIELLVVVAMLGLVVAIVAPNLGALVPSARLRGSGSLILRELDWVRSEARIQSKRMVMEFDLEKGRWRIVYPPEQQLTRDQDTSTLEERPDRWIDLEADVEFVGAGDGKTGLATKDTYRIVFDEYGFTGDQVLVLGLVSDPTMTWTMSIQGLSGRVDVHESETGEKPIPPVLNDGAF